MIERGSAGQVKMGMDGSRFRIRCAVDQFLDPGLNHGAHTHDARLDRDHQYGTGKAIVAQAVAAVAKREDLGMSRRIIRTYRVIVAASDDLAVDQEYSAYRDFPLGFGLASLVQSLPHP